GVEAIYCLGDTVGYGPNPRECLELAMTWPVVVLGNFDLAVMLNPPDLGPAALSASRSLAWSRRELDAAVPDATAADRRRQFLAELPRTVRETDRLFVHGSPRNPLHEYVFPEDVY